MTKFIRFPEVHERTQRSRSRIYEDMQAGTFPKPVKLGSRAVGWVESEVQEWIDKRMADRA